MPQSIRNFAIMVSVEVPTAHEKNDENSLLFKHSSVGFYQNADLKGSHCRFFIIPFTLSLLRNFKLVLS